MKFHIEWTRSGAGRCAIILNLLDHTGRHISRASSLLSGKNHYSRSWQHAGRHWGDAGEGVDAVSEEAYSRTAHHSD